MVDVATAQQATAQAKRDARRRFSGLPRQRVVATRSNRLQSGRYTNTVGDGRTYKVRVKFPQACSQLRLKYGNVYSGGWGETPNTNALFVKAVLVKSDGTVHQVTFNGGKPSLYLPSGTQVAAPSAPTVTAGTVGRLTNAATYYVGVTYVNEAGETTLSTRTQVTVGSSNPSFTVTAPAAAAGASGYRVYVEAANGTNTGPFLLVSATKGFGEDTVVVANPSTNAPREPQANSTAGATGSSSGIAALIAESDPVPCDIAAGEYAYVVTHVNTPNPGGFIPVGTAIWGNTLGTGEGVSGADTTGNHASIPTTTNTTTYSPMAITGIPADATKPSIAIIGDSISEGTGDPLIGPGDPGFVIKAINDNYPYAWLAKGGELAADFLNTSGSLKQRRLVRGILASHCNVSINNYGTNDVGAGDSLATIKARLLSIWADMKRLGHENVAHCTLVPRTKSLDGWKTAGPGNGTTTGQYFYENASYGTAHVQEDVRQGLNQWLRAPKEAGAGNSARFDASGNLDTIIDTALTVEVNADGSATSVNPSTGALTGGTGGYWKAAEANASTGTATAGSTSTITNSGASWTTNQWSGYMVLITSGTAAGQVAQVISNTATVLTLNGTITAPANGSGYALYQGYAQDGIHPAKPGHDRMKTPVQTWLATL